MTPLNLSSKLTPLFEYIKKRQEDRKFQETIELAGTFILISFFLLVAIRPTALTISALVGEIKSKEILSRGMKSKIFQVILAQDLFSQVQERFSLVDSALPSLPRFSQATTEIDGFLTQEGLAVEKLDFLIKDTSYFSTVVATTSSFSSGLNLVSSLLQSRRLLEIPHIGFSVDKESAESRQVTLNLPVNVYFWKNQINEKK